VASSPADARGIGVKAKATRTEKGPIELALAIDARTLALAGADGRPDRLELLVVPQREDGQAFPAEYSTLNLDTSPKVRQYLLQSGLNATRRLVPPPEASKLRIVLRQASTGALGSTTVPLRSAEPL
jgi:hypothetical protein